MFLRPATRILAGSRPRIIIAAQHITANPVPKAPFSTPTMFTQSPTTQATQEDQPQPQHSQPATPMEDSIRTKLTSNLHPSTLEIHNDSHLHAHHAAMQSPAYAAAKETHFRVRIISDAFAGKMQPARHRMVYALLRDEMQAEGGVHALQLVTRTTEEEERAAAKKA